MSIISLFANAKNSIAELEELSVESVTSMLDTLLKAVLKKNPADKKKKDENKPKKALNSYMLYCKEFRKTFQEQNKEMKPTDISRLLGTSWNKLSEKEKQVYKDIYVVEKSDSESESTKTVTKPASKKAEPKSDSESESTKKLKKPAASKKAEPKSESESTKKLKKPAASKKAEPKSDSDSESE